MTDSELLDAKRDLAETIYKTELLPNLLPTEKRENSRA